MKKLRNDKKGAAVIAALAIMAVFITLGLAMLLTSSVLMHTAQKKNFEEQCRISAVTMSKELERDIEDSTSDFYSYIKSNIHTTGTSPWPYFNVDELGHGESFDVYKNFDVSGSGTENTGAVTAKMYWEWENGGELSDIFLHVAVTAEKGGESQTVNTVYNLNVDGTGAWIWCFFERY